ncbi:MAG: methyltransferase domain-containing protein [Chloroflexi bacterium]|nr:methyltransferase domain-containing protein [Chloroflexota bacterium]
MSVMGWLVDGLEWMYNRATGRRPDLAREVASRLGPRPPGDLLLDLGAGDGRIGGAVGKATGGRVILCDPDEAKLRRRPPGSWAVVAVGAALPFRDGTFGGSFLVNVLHHLVEPGPVMDELARVLLPDALLVVLDFRPTSPLTRLLCRMRPIVCASCRFRGPEDLRRIAEVFGIVWECGAVDAHEYACVCSQASGRPDKHDLPVR